MCLVQINFVVVGLKQKCLGLHRMCVNNGTKDNIMVDAILVQGLGWNCITLDVCIQFTALKNLSLRNN